MHEGPLDREHIRDVAAAAVLAIAAGLLVASFVLQFTAGASNGAALVLVALTILALGLGVALSAGRRRLSVLPIARDRTPERRRLHWTFFKLITFTTGGLLLVAPLAVAGAIVLQRFGPGTLPGEVFAPLDRALVALTLAIVSAVAYLTWSSLRRPTTLPIAPHASLAAGGLFLVLVAPVILTILAAVGHLAGSSAYIFDPHILLILACFVLVATFSTARPVPSGLSLLRNERAAYSGKTYLTRAKSNLMPLFSAIALVAWSVALLILLQARLSGLRLAWDLLPLRLGLIGYAAIVLVLTIVAVPFLVRGDHLPVYQTAASREARQRIVLLGVSAVFSVVFLSLMTVLALGRPLPWIGAPEGRWVDFLALGILAAVGPYGFYYAHKERRMRLLEERFPGFLRDLAAARKAGLTLDQAVLMARRGDYGELNREIEKMADQLTWNMPFEEVLRHFSERVRTPLVERAVSIINEASRTGGNIASVLQAAADDAQELKEIHDERRTSMRVYAGIVYIGFLIFLGVAAVMYATLVPELLESAQSVSAAGGQGDEISGLTVNASVTINDYRVFYFIAALAQAVGTGFIAGLMGSGRWPLGLQHIFVMGAMALAAFVFLA